MGNITNIQIFLIFLFISSTNEKISNTNQKVSNTKTLNPLIIKLSLILLVYLQFLKNITSLTQKNYFLILFSTIVDFIGLFTITKKTITLTPKK